MPDWFPDWSGQAVAIVASGPSAKKAGVDQLRGRLKVVAIKENVELCPWADAVYGCDRAWWRNERGLPKFGGLKIAFDPMLRCEYPDIHLVEIDKLNDRLLFDRPGLIGSGGNSGFQAVNIVAQFGAKRILLVGFDMHGRSGVHWYGRNRGNGRNNPSEDNFRRWRAAFAGSVGTLVERGIDVFNASPMSALACFRRGSVAVALAEWNL